jgi:hypothetical protein
MPVRRVKLRCHCDGVLDEFRVPDHPPGDAFRFVKAGRVRPEPSSPEERDGLERLKAAGLGDFGPSRPHVDKRFVSRPGDPKPRWRDIKPDWVKDEDEDWVADALYAAAVDEVPRSIVWYGCHPQRCGRGWYLWVRELADACYEAGRLGRREVYASDFDHQGAAATYWRKQLEHLLATREEIEAFHPADQKAMVLGALSILAHAEGGMERLALADLHKQAVEAYSELLRRAEAIRVRDGAA